MRWLVVLYLGSVVYAYTFAAPIPRPRKATDAEANARVLEGRMMRVPQSVPAGDQDFADGIGLSDTSMVIRHGGKTDPHMLIHFDSHGLIVQADGDGGDTAQRIGMVFFRYHDAQAFERALDQLEVAPGIYVRHPYQPGFRSDPNRFSRDQQRPIIMALGMYDMHDRLGRMALAHLLRFGKYQNKDYLGPSHLGEYLRAFKAWPLYPVLFFTDVGLLVSSVDIAVRARLDGDNVDDNNHLMALIQSKQVMPTPLSWLASRIYKDFRPLNLGNQVLGEEDPVQGALSWYHRAESGGNPFIAELYRPAIAGL